MASQLNQKIWSADMDITIQENYLYRLEKLIGYPDADQKNLRKQISVAKKELASLEKKKMELINQWAEAEGSHHANS